MSISILIVDDIRAIAEGFGRKFRQFSIDHFDVGTDVETLCASDEAVRRISDESKPKFDLLFTDIDLSGGDCPDRDGVAFARFAKRIMPDVPLVGCSGLFDENDLGEEARSLFDKWWPKSRLSDNLEEISRDTLSRAIAYHKQRVEHDSKVQQMNATLATPITDKDFLDAGYIKGIIEPLSTNGLVVPFAVWVKHSDEGVELEVVDCGAIFTWGDTYEYAEAGIMEIINDMKRTLHESNESFSPSLLRAKRFVETVTGYRNVGKEA